MLDQIRAKGYEALRSARGNALPPMRWTRGVLSFLNDMLGRPLAPADEIRERREYEERRRALIAEAVAKKQAEPAPAAAANGQNGKNGHNGKVAAPKEAAPVVVYLDDRSQRELKRIEGVLKGRDIPFTKLNIENDEATKSWVQTASRKREMPVVFIAGKPIGASADLMRLDAAGGLEKLVYG